MTTLEFFEELWGYKQEDHWLLIYTLPDKKSRWFKDLERAARYCEQRREVADVYFGVSLSPQAHFDNQRLKRGEREPVAVYGMWADIDIAGPNHGDTEKVYPPTLDDALRLICDLSVEPTCIVHSGGGLHCHFVFKEPWTFDTDEEVSEARILAFRWSRTIKARAKVRGWDVDSVSDLERVLRVPGTYNHKSAEPQLVRVL